MMALVLGVVLLSILVRLSVPWTGLAHVGIRVCMYLYAQV